MKKTFLSTIVFVVLVSLFPLSPVIAEENDNLEALQVSQEIANISEKAIPSNLSEMENWKNETQDLMELEYGLSVVDVFENLESITFIFEEITHDLAEEGVIYPTIIEYIKPTYIDSRGLLNAKAVPQTKYVEGIMYSGTSLMKKNSFLANLSRSGILAVLSSAIGVSTGHTAVVTTAEVIVSNIASAIKSGLPNTSTVIADVYTQTKTTNRSGQVGIVAWNGTVAWKPTYIVEKFDYYSYVQGRIYYSNKPARPYTTNNVLYKTFMNTYFNSTQESFRSRALTYYNKGEIYINGKIYKM